MDSPALRVLNRLLLIAWLVVLLAVQAAAQERPFGGVGLQVVPVSGGELVVLQIVPSSPAAGSDLRPGDLLIEVDGFGLAGSDFAEVVSRRLWGEVGSSVTLRYLRPGREGQHAVTLRRTPLSPPDEPPVGVRLLTPGNE